MKTARRVGWGMMVMTILAGASVLLAYELKSVIDPTYHFGVNIILVSSWIIFLICANYAFWGLLSGCNKAAWDRHVKRLDSVQRKQIEAACNSQEADPPTWLK